MLENIEQTNEPPKQFTFDGVYAEDSITENLYAESVFPLVESVRWWSKTNKNTSFSFCLFRYLKVIMQQYSHMGKRGKESKQKRESFLQGSSRCGKSFTMQGLNTPGSPQRGVIPRSFEVGSEEIFSLTGNIRLISAYIRCFGSCYWNEVFNSCIVSGNLQRKYSRFTRQRC